jgi:hypothetical protein
VLSNGFLGKGGSNFRDYIAGCATNIAGRPANENEEIVLEEAVAEVNASALLGEGLKLYPNPANASVTVALSSGEIKNLIVTAIDGKTVLIRSVDSQNQFTLDITAFSKGIYLITIEDSEGNIQTEKLIKE